MLKRLVSKLRLGPLSIRVDFPRRTYVLGETIPINIEVTSRNQAIIENGVVDLVCIERYAETIVKMERIGLYPKRKPLPKDMFAKRDVKVLTENYVHSSTIFLVNSKLQAHSTSNYFVRLVIQSNPPPHTNVGTAAWFLETRISTQDGVAVNQKNKLIVEVN